MGLSKAVRMIIIGAPGAGKGTQTSRLMKRFPQLSSISSGDLLRRNVMDRTPLGIQAESKMKSGALLPDAVILRLIVNEFNTRGWIVGEKPTPYTVYASARGETVDSIVVPLPLHMQSYTYTNSPSASFILDGFPRTASQAAQLDHIVPINFVVNIRTPASVILDRISNRWVHAPSGRVYNTKFNAPKVAGRDDISGELLTRRDDDDPETWKARLKSFEETSIPLLEHYEKLGVLWSVSGSTSDEISPKLFEEFQRRFEA